MGSSADARVKLDGHRRAIRDHIRKYEEYPMQHDKQYALKTIRRVQGEIQDIRKRHPQLPEAPEDTWKPQN